MKIDLVYFGDEMLISKLSADWEIWQSKLFYYKANLTFESTAELIEHLKIDYKLSEIELKKIENLILESHTQMFIVNLITENQSVVEVTRISNILNQPNELIYWNNPTWSFSKLKNEYFLWVYVGGIADICREIKLSDSEKEKFLQFGKSYIIKFASEISEFNSEKYKQAINENRKIL